MRHIINFYGSRFGGDGVGANFPQMKLRSVLTFSVDVLDCIRYQHAKAQSCFATLRLMKCC
jgi:hypothetical protein